MTEKERWHTNMIGFKKRQNLKRKEESKTETQVSLSSRMELFKALAGHLQKENDYIKKVCFNCYSLIKMLIDQICVLIDLTWHSKAWGI